MLGRTFTTADDVRGGLPDGPVAVLSHDFWRRHFAGSPDAIGKPIVLGSVTFTVIGVTPASFFGPRVGRRFDVVLPLGVEPLLSGANSGLDLVGRNWLGIMVSRRPGQSLDAATTALRGVQPQILDATLRGVPPPAVPRYLRTPFDLTPAFNGSSPLRARYREPLVMLMAIVAGVLLIACVNIANLMLARGVARRHEMSVRVALGASRLHVARLMLAEAVVLSSTGALLGLGLARWLTPLLVQQLSTRGNAVFLDLAPDWRVLAFAIAVTIVTAVLFGTVPAWQSARADPAHALKEQHRGAVGGGSRFGSVLVSVQVALSLVLVVAAGLFIRTVAGLATQHVGATRDRVLVVNVTPPMTQYTLPKLVAVYDRVREVVAALPGVERAALSDITPVGGSSRTTAAEVTGGVALEGDNGIASVNVVSAGWLATYGMRLRGGREFAETDRINTAPVAMVNEAFARRFLNGANPIGRTLSTGAGRARQSFEIVGLVEDTVYRSLRDPAPPTIFTPTMQRSAARPYVNVSVLAAGGSPLLLSRPIAEAIRQIDPSFVLQFRPLTEQVNEAMTQERVVAWLSGFFGALALLLAGLGLYGVTAYSVSRRRPEIGMRLALGATPMAVVSLIMKRVAVLVCAGTAAGALVSLWASRFVGTLVWGLEPDDPMTLVAAALVLALVAALAGWIPAWRASRIDPIVALRTE